jgi:hypothetical protein
MQAGSTGASESYNPLALTSFNVAWTDLNRDGVLQGETWLHVPDGRVRAQSRATAERIRRREPVELRPAT